MLPIAFLAVASTLDLHLFTKEKWNYIARLFAIFFWWWAWFVNRERMSQLNRPLSLLKFHLPQQLCAAAGTGVTEAGKTQQLELMLLPYNPFHYIHAAPTYPIPISLFLLAANITPGIAGWLENWLRQGVYWFRCRTSVARVKLLKCSRLRQTCLATAAEAAKPVHALARGFYCLHHLHTACNWITVTLCFCLTKC